MKLSEVRNMFSKLMDLHLEGGKKEHISDWRFLETPNLGSLHAKLYISRKQYCHVLREKTESCHVKKF